MPASTLQTYQAGQTFTLTHTFTDAAADASLVIRRPDGTTTTHTTADDLVDDTGGAYHLDLTADQPGDWAYNWAGTGTTGTEVAADVFYVIPDPTTGVLNADALTTLHAAREWVLRNVGGETQDGLLARLINAASTAISNFTEREFKPADNETRTLNYDGEGVLSLSPWELRAITGLTITPDGSTLPQTLASRFYKPEPAQRTPEGTYLNLRIADQYAWPVTVANQSSWARWSFGNTYEVAVTGDWGMDAVPADVELACLITVADGYRNPGSLTSYAQAGGLVGGEPLTGGANGNIPIGARRLLLPYKRQRRVGSVRLSPHQDTYGLPNL